MLTGRKKIKTNKNLHNPFWHHGLWDAAPARGPGAAGKEAGATGCGPLTKSISLQSPAKARALPEPPSSSQLLLCMAGQWQGPVGKGLGASRPGF